MVECKDTSNKRGLPKVNIGPRQFAIFKAINANCSGVELEYWVRGFDGKEYHVPFWAVAHFMGGKKGIFPYSELAMWEVKDEPEFERI